MKSQTPSCLMFAVLAIISASMCLAADVSIQRDGDIYQVKAVHYAATVEPDGCMPHLLVEGQEFFSSSPSFPRGAYLYQNGLLKLSSVEQVGDNVLTAKCDKASIQYEFTADEIAWTTTNLSDQAVLCLIVADSQSPIRCGGEGCAGRAQLVVADSQSPKRRLWLFPGRHPPGSKESRICASRGGTKVWGPWGQSLQVWEASVGAKETRKIVIQTNRATEDEVTKAEAVASSPPPPPPTDPVGPMWNLKKLSKPPVTFPAEGFEAEGVKALFFAGPPFQGRPTRVFAWLGFPKVEPGKKVPGMVLVHGGGGTAFANWVRLWNERGYAAIAMDTCGCVPKGTYGNWERHDDGGPPGWGGWGQTDWPREDQWTYHAVADAILAHSLLRSLPEVDADRIGLTGISWGGYLTSILAGVDPRFKFAAPVYGCGFTNEHGFAGSVAGLGKERGDRWMRWWDPSSYLGNASMPILWVTGSNDFAYTMNALQKSYRLPKSPRTLCLRLRMPHGHGPAGEGPKEIQVFADSLLKGGDPLPRITGQGRENNQVWATYESKVAVTKAELNCTKDTGKWQDRKWEAAPAQLDGKGKVTATLPENISVCYINLFDERDCVVSTEHEEVALQK